jgi:hypothetical protein
MSGVRSVTLGIVAAMMCRVRLIRRFPARETVTFLVARRCIQRGSAVPRRELVPAGEPVDVAGSPMALAIISMALGIPLSAIALAVGTHPAGIVGLLVVWIAITAINIAYNVSYANVNSATRSQQPPDRH